LHVALALNLFSLFIFHFTQADADENFNDVTLESGLSDSNIVPVDFAKDSFDVRITCDFTLDGVRELEKNDSVNSGDILIADDSNAGDSQSISSLSDCLKPPAKLVNGKRVQIFTVGGNNDGSTSPRPDL